MAERQIETFSIDQLNVARTAKREANIEPDEFKKLITLLQASEALDGLMELLPSLINVIPLSEKIAKLENNLEIIDKFLNPASETTSGLIPIADTLRREGQKQLFEGRLKSRYEIFKGLVSKQPLYACLGLLPVIDVEDKGYQLLQAQLLIFSARHFGENLISHLNLFKAVADLCEPKHSKELYCLPKHPVSAYEYYGQLANSPSKRLKVIGELFKEAPQPLHPPRPELSEPPKRRKKHSLHRKDRVSHRSNALPSSRKTLLTEDEARGYELRGGHREEIQPPDEEIPTALPEEILSGATFRNLCFMAKQESNRRAINNQLFQYAWQEASLYDISILMDFIMGKQSLPNGNTVKTDTKAALYLSLFLSRSLEELADYHSRVELPLPDDTSEGIFQSEQGELFARIYSPGPKLSEENKNKDWPHAHPVITFSHIPLPYLSKEVFDFLKPSRDNSSKRLFPEDISNWIVQTKLAIRGLRKEYGCRLSPARISQFLMHELSRQESEDLPKAALYFGLDLELAETRVHYSIAHLPSIEKSYRSLCNEIFQKLNLEIAFSDPLLKVNPDSHIGTPFCPRMDAVQSLTRSIQNNLEELASNLKDKATLIQYHNHYTIYCALLSAYASGYRAITDRFLKPKELDSETGVAVISDKDTPDKYNTRQVWIHPMCQEQIFHYQQHLLALFDRIGLDSSSIFSRVQDLIWPEILSDFFLFTEGKTECFELLTPTVLRTFLADEYDYNMPPNSNRHFLKNHLLKDNCPQEIVESFLGHWHNGQEPWNSLSTLHPADYQSYLETHLGNILSECSWQSLPGKLL